MKLLARFRLTLIALACVGATSGIPDTDPIVVASKHFPESYVLAEIISQMLEEKGYEVDRRFGLGGTNVCYEALINGEIHVYPEYTGTITQAILELQDQLTPEQINEKLNEHDLEILDPFGFNNTYAMAMRDSHADELGLTKVSQLADHPDLKIVVTHEFLERADGWPHLQRIYGLTQSPEGIEHALALRAISDGSVDVTDGYSTDAELLHYGLRILEDDRGAFPLYLALPIIRNDLSEGVRNAINSVAGLIDEPTVIDLNGQVVYEEKSFAEVASAFLYSVGLKATDEVTTSITDKLTKNVLRHLQLTAIALLLATSVALIISFAIYRIVWLSRAVVYVCGLLQTIPSIALLALMIPLFGIGIVPAIVALFLYSLLPIVRNCVTALSTTDPMLIRVAEGMGLSQGERLRHVLIPLATPSVLAGIRTSAVICIGTATLAAFIGAGGLGDPIVTGLALNNTGIILQGAIPAALLAILTELVFEGIERLAVPGHLKAFAPGTETIATTK